ncbi:tautomerase family protein [Candidatus Bathyarchaeota archaeon]|nr:tautomerase family protein [Candidatus Bathyarchaeota archaeon]MBS7629638.1 tautomerase family protein [Candidatus Bathyarchaeota archaeon]
MPYVQVNLLEGRSEEQIERLVEAITDAIVNILGVPKEVVWIEFNEMPKNRFAQGGVLRSKRQP